MYVDQRKKKQWILLYVNCGHASALHKIDGPILKILDVIFHHIWLAKYTWRVWQQFSLHCRWFFKHRQK